MTKDEVRLALEIMDEEDEKIRVLLEEMIDTCGECARRTRDGADAGCIPCIARDVMNR
jgi:hypothetical protein